MNAVVPDRSPRRTSVAAIVLRMIAAAILATIGSCAYLSHSRNKAFHAVQIGASEESVIDLFGSEPSVREKPSVLFGRYTGEPCEGSCAERLWFENRLTLDTKAWSIEIDQNRHVIKKSRWTSP